MPIITGMSDLNIRLVNTTLVKAFQPRAKDWLHPKFCGRHNATALLEPFAIGGTAPGLRKYKGVLPRHGLKTFSLQVPQELFKNASEIQRDALEADQTRTLINFAQTFGVRLAEFPEQLWAKKLITGSNVTSKTIVHEGQTYNTTFDGAAFFSASHDTGRGGTQSNLISGNLPSTIPSLASQDLSTTANQMGRDLQAFIAAVKSLKDTEGQLLYPTLDTKKSVIVVVPPCLETAATLAFRTPSSAVIAQTTNILPNFVKEVVSSGYLAGFPDPDTGDMIYPPNETDYYFIITDDIVKPFYLHTFRPLGKNALKPDDFNGDDQIDKLLKAQSDMTIDEATVLAATMVETTFNRQGNDADAYTIEKESFLVSGRYRGTCAYGFWPNAFRVIPSGGKTDYADNTDESSSSDSSASTASSNSSSSSSSSSSS